MRPLNLFRGILSRRGAVLRCRIHVPRSVFHDDDGCQRTSAVQAAATVGQ
jgi:hypothetical protein